MIKAVPTVSFRLYLALAGFAVLLGPASAETPSLTASDVAGRSFARLATMPLPGGVCPADDQTVWHFAADGHFRGLCDGGRWSLEAGRLILTFAGGPAPAGINPPGTIVCTDQTEHEEFYQVAPRSGGLEASPPVGPAQYWQACVPAPPLGQNRPR